MKFFSCKLPVQKKKDRRRKKKQFFSSTYFLAGLFSSLASFVHLVLYFFFAGSDDCLRVYHSEKYPHSSIRKLSGSSSLFYSCSNVVKISQKGCAFPTDVRCSILVFFSFKILYHCKSDSKVSWISASKKKKSIPTRRELQDKYWRNEKTTFIPFENMKSSRREREGERIRTHWSTSIDWRGAEHIVLRFEAIEEASSHCDLNEAAFSPWVEKWHQQVHSSQKWLVSYDFLEIIIQAEGQYTYLPFTNLRFWSMFFWGEEARGEQCRTLPFLQTPTRKRWKNSRRKHEERNENIR